jgi:hypothetical protein
MSFRERSWQSTTDLQLIAVSDILPTFVFLLF